MFVLHTGLLSHQKRLWCQTCRFKFQDGLELKRFMCGMSMERKHSDTLHCKFHTWSRKQSCRMWMCHSVLLNFLSHTAKIKAALRFKAENLTFVTWLRIGNVCKPQATMRFSKENVSLNVEPSASEDQLSSFSKIRQKNMTVGRATEFRRLSWSKNMFLPCSCSDLCLTAP